MATITVATKNFLNWTHGGTAATLRIYALQSFFTSGGNYIPQSNVSTGDCYKSVNCTISGTTLTIPEITIDSTNDSTNKTAQYVAFFYDENSIKRNLWLGIPFKVPYQTTSTTWDSIFEYNNAPSFNPTHRYYDTDQIDARLTQIVTQSGAQIYATASGTNTYTATVSPAITSYTTGQVFNIKFTNANTSTATINLNSLGAKSIKKNATEALGVNDIKAGQMYALAYDGTNFQLLGSIADTGNMPSGGATGQALIKTSSADYDTEWGVSGDVLGWVNVLDYGAVGNGVADDTDAIQDAIVAAAAGSGVVYLPAGTYNFTQLDLRSGGNGTLTFRGAQGYQWTGNYAGTSTQGRTKLHCTVLTAADGIIAFQAQGLIIEDIQFSYDDGYTGILLNIGGAGGVGTNTALVQRCHFISDVMDTYKTANAFIGLRNIVFVTLQDCSFMGAQSLIRGREANTDFSNCVVIERCQFEDCAVGAIVNPYLNWRIHNSLFEFTNADIPCSITSDGDEILPGYTTDIVMTNCWFWDSAAPSTQIPIMQVADIEWDITVRDCWFHNFNLVAEMLGTGSFIFEDNRIFTGVPTPSATIIDCGEFATAPKDLIRIVGNKWQANGSQADAIINTADHTRIKISNNSQTHANWDTEFTGSDPNPWTIAPSAVTCNDANSGYRFKGGTVTLGTGVTEGSYWEFHTLAYTSTTIVITLPSGYYFYVDGTAQTGSATLTVTGGMVRITKISPDATAGQAAGFWNVEVHGTYTFA